MNGTFRRVVHASSRAVASPWAFGLALLYVVGSTVWLVHTGGDEKQQLWVNHIRNAVTLLLLVLLHAEEETEG